MKYTIAVCVMCAKSQKLWRQSLINGQSGKVSARIFRFFYAELCGRKAEKDGKKVSFQKRGISRFRPAPRRGDIGGTGRLV